MLVSVFSKILLISIMAAVLIVLVLLVKAVFKEKLSARWHYYIWFLLIARLIIPYTPEFSVNLNEFLLPIQDNIRIQSESNPADSVDNNLRTGLIDKGEGKFPEYNSSYNLASNDKKEESENSEKEKNINNKLKLMIVTIASKIWLCGIFFFVAYILIVNCVMNYRIKKTSVSIESGNVQDVLEYCKKLVKIKQDIPIVYQKHIKTPAICGVFKTKMLIPPDILDLLSIDEIRYVILHELCHFKRKDTMIGMIQMLLCVLHWFNPLIWYAFNKMKEDREPVCDELVLSYIKPDERRNYAETLIKILKYFSENHWVYSTANLSQGSVTNMEWRLRLMSILKKRSVILGVVIALVTVTLGMVGVLFINKHFSFALPVSSADANSLTAIKDELPTRGKISDRNGKEFAVSIPADTIALSPREIKASGQDSDSIAKTLADILALEKEKVFEKVTASSAYEIIKRNVDKETGNKIREWISNNNIKGMIIDEDSKRYYPNDHLAAHVIGFTGMGGNAGLTGIELSMEQYLKLKGTNVSVDGKKTLQSGANIVLTIDIGIQRIVENALDKAMQDYQTMNGAAAIIMDPRSGEILAMVSRPDFNPNMPYSPPPGVDSGTWKGSTQDEAKVLAGTLWKNKALSDTFEPGSVFKAITSAAGLEEGIVTPETQVDDATVSVSGYKINCWKPNFHGKETFREAIYNSCNPVFVKIGQSIGIDMFYTYVRNFGFYDRTGIEFPDEVQSIIHTKPAEIDMAVASLGQRFQVTPLQLVSAYGAIANDGKLMKPQIIKKITDTENGSTKTYEPQVVRNVISKKTADSMKDLLEGAVSKGTAANAYVEGYKIAGSIGTSEKVNGKYMASFVGFAPSNNPKFACIIILDEPMVAFHTGGMIAAPVAGKIIKDVLDYMSKN